MAESETNREKRRRKRIGKMLNSRTTKIGRAATEIKGPTTPTKDDSQSADAILAEIDGLRKDFDLINNDKYTPSEERRIEELKGYIADGGEYVDKYEDSGSNPMVTGTKSDVNKYQDEYKEITGEYFQKE